MKSTTHRYLLTMVLGGLTCLGFNTLTLAEPQTESPIPMFDAAYLVSSSAVPFKITAHRTLTKEGNDLFQLRMHANTFFTKLEELSRFQWQENCGIKSQYYHFKRSGLGSNEDRRIEFDWQKKIATYRDEDEHNEINLHSDAVDKLGEHMAIRCLLRKGTKAFKLEIVDDDGLRSHEFEVEKNETVETPAGEFEAIKVIRVRDEKKKRTTEFWLAPELDHLLIRFEQTREDGDSFKIELKKVTTSES